MNTRGEPGGMVTTATCESCGGGFTSEERELLAKETSWEPGQQRVGGLPGEEASPVDHALEQFVQCGQEISALQEQLEEAEKAEDELATELAEARHEANQLERSIEEEIARLEGKGKGTEALIDEVLALNQPPAPILVERHALVQETVKSLRALLDKEEG